MEKRAGSEQEGAYKATLTREQFLFFETRETARLMQDGLNDVEVVSKICQENVFQYPTEKTLRRMACLCVERLRAMKDPALISAMAFLPADEAKQICLYAVMKHSRLVREFMVSVIGEKYRQQDMAFSKADINVFFIHLQEQNDTVAAWSDSTVARIKQVLTRILVENEYLDAIGSVRLNPVLLGKTLENAIRTNGDEALLPAFNCFC